MLRTKTALACSLVGLLLAAGPLAADDWTTAGFDAQRSSWVRKDLKTSPASVGSPDFRFLWRIELANEPRRGNTLTAPALLDFLISHRGFRSLAFVGGSSGGIFAMDTDLARMEWERHFLPGSGATSDDCPGGMTSSVTRPTAAAMPSMLGFTARGRRSPAKSGVGAPREGAVTLLPASSTPSSSPAQRPPDGRTRRQARPALRGVTLVHALSARGHLHTLYVSNGRDHVPPIPFLPSGANAQGLIVVDGHAYVATRNRCGGAPDGVWALDLESRQVSTWESGGGPVAGPGAIALDPAGTVYAATRNGPLVALEARTLKVRSSSESAGYKSSPVVFDRDGADHVAVLRSDGVLAVYQASDLGQPIATASVEGAGGPGETALAAWMDASGARWILVPGRSAVSAWKLAGTAGELRLVKGWESPAMDAPQPAIVVNGVVFALDGGTASGRAVLYALEGSSGDRLWDSGDAIRATARGHALASGPGHVFLTASDSAVYAFGFPMEH